MYKIGFTTVTFRSLSRARVAELAAENGVSALEWGGDVHLPPDDPNALCEVLELQKKYGLQAMSYGSYYRLGMRDFNLFENIADTARAIGAGRVRIWQGGKPSREAGGDFSDMVAEAIALAKLAEQRGLKIAFEFHNGTNNDCGDSAIKFLEAVGRANVGTYWQPLGGRNDEENLEKVLPYLLGVHVFHWSGRGKRYALKRGADRWKNYAAIIKKAEVETDFIMEFVKGDSPKRFKKDMATLGEILGEVYGR